MSTVNELPAWTHLGERFRANTCFTAASKRRCWVWVRAEWATSAAQKWVSRPSSGGLGGGQLVEQVVQLLAGMNALARHSGVHLDVDGEAGAFQPAHLLRGPDDRGQRVLSERLHVLLREAAHYQDCGLAAARDACLGERTPRARALTRAGDAQPRRSGVCQSRRAESIPCP